MKTLRVTSAEPPRSSATSPVQTIEVEEPPLQPLPPQIPAPGKLLELTPLWEQVTRTGQLPPNFDPAMVFAELGSRLRDPEWEVRQHGLRVLSDLIPALGARRLDRCLPAVLSELTANLGHPSAAVRKGASDTLRKCIRESTNPDNVLRAVIARSNSDDRNISMGVVVHIPTLLDERISHHTLAIIIGALAKKLIQVSFQEHALKSLVRIRDMVGDNEFSKFLAKYHPQCKQDFDILCQVYEIGECLSDSGIDLQYPGPPIGWCEDIPDIFEPARRVRPECKDEECSSADDIRAHTSRVQRSNESSSSSSSRPSTSRVSKVHEDDSSCGEEEQASCSTRPQTSRPQTSRPQTNHSTTSRPQSGRVVLETEIKFNEKTAITMTILEEEEERRSANEARTPVSESQTPVNEDDGEDDGMFIKGTTSTPTTPRRARRVTFGGEQVLKTPPLSANVQQVSRPSQNLTQSSEGREFTGVDILHLDEDKIAQKIENVAQEMEKVAQKIETKKELLNAQIRKTSLSNNNDNTKLILKPSLIPVRIPSDNGPKIKPVRPLSRYTEIRNNKPIVASYTMMIADTYASSGPDLIKEIMPASKPDILITEASLSPESDDKECKTSEMTSVASSPTPSSPPSPTILSRSGSPPVPALSAAMARASSPIPLAGQDLSIPTLEGGESLTGSSPEPEEQGSSNAVEEARVASALASLEDLQNKGTAAAASWEDLAIVDASVMEDLRDRVAFTLLVAAVLAEPQYIYSGVPTGYYGGVYPYTSSVVSPVVNPVVNPVVTPYVSPYVSPYVTKSFVPAVTYPVQDTSRGLPQPVQDTPEDDWRARVRGAQQLKAALRSSAAMERLRAHLPEFLAFLESMLEDSSPRVVAATLATYARLAEALGQRLKPHARHVAGALCRPASSPRAEVKLEAAHAAKALMAGVGVQTACTALAESLRARSHRHREAALQLFTLGLLAFPSSQFDAPDLAHRVVHALADSKRRVRQVALEVTAVLAQFIPPTALPIHLASERLRSRQSQEALHAAVSARLSRRSLPVLSPDGLILYSVQLPPHAARGLPGTPSGADVEWILAGSGSTSPGSARSRSQLHSASRRASSEDSLHDEPAVLTTPRSSRERNHVRKRQSLQNSTPVPSRQTPFNSMETSNGSSISTPVSNKTEDEVTWTLLPVGSMQDEALGPVWTAEIAGGEAPTTGDGLPRPMYLRLLRRQPEHVAALDKERGYILLPSKQLAASLSPVDPTRSPKVTRRVSHLQPLASPEPTASSNHESREEHGSPLPLRPTLARSGSSERRGNAVSREGSASSSFDSEGSPPQRSSSLRRPRREKRERNLSDPMLVNLGTPRHQPNPVSPRHQITTSAESRTPVGGSTPPGSPSPSSDNPIPQKPVLARNNNNNGSGGLRRASLSSPSLEKPLGGDDVSLVEVVPIEKALDLLGAKSSRPSSTEGRRMFPSVDTTPPALGASRSFHYFSHLEGVGPGCTPAPTRLEPRRHFFKQPPETPNDFQHNVTNQMSSSPTLSTRSFHFPRPPVSPDIPDNVSTLRLDTQSTPLPHDSAVMSTSALEATAQSLEDHSNSSYLHHADVSADAEISASVGVGSSETQDSGDLSGGVIARPLPPRARPARNTVAVPRRHRSKDTLGRGSSGSGGSTTGSSSSLKHIAELDGPIRRPQEALAQCQLQMGGQDWEGVMTGLNMLRRLTKHHPDVVASNLHSVIVDVTRHVRNLRSQVSRTACSVAGELAVALRRGLDNELEELVAPLLHRSADTNRFLRDDCGKALDLIMENTAPSRSVPAVISQGASHKNSVVRATTARLLAQVVTRLGADKILGASSPGGANSAVGLTREVRGRLLKTIASFLTEGSLDARTHAKKAFDVLMKHDAFEVCLEQAVQPNLLRSIHKTLSALRRAHGIIPYSLPPSQ